jgi:hypothetical protein
MLKNKAKGSKRITVGANPRAKRVEFRSPDPSCNGRFPPASRIVAIELETISQEVTERFYNRLHDGEIQPLTILPRIVFMSARVNARNADSICNEHGFVKPLVDPVGLRCTHSDCRHKVLT